MVKMPFLNTVVDNLSFDEALVEIDKLATQDGNSVVVTPNVDHIVRLEKDEDFRRAYEGATLVLADGQPLLWISRLLRTPIKEKVSGSDLLPRVCEMAATKGYSVFFLGAADGVGKRASFLLKQRFPALDVSGVYSPEIGFEESEIGIRETLSRVNAAHPEILFVGLGSPKQEEFLSQYKDDLEVKVSLAIGAAIDFEAGNVRRAPRWMQRAGLEWFFRLYQEPRRLAKRYLVDDMAIFPIFFRYLRSKAPH